MAEKLSGPMKRVLLNLVRGEPACSHCFSISDYGGLHKTMLALVRRGLLTSDGVLTVEGKRAAQAVQRDNIR